MKYTIRLENEITHEYYTDNESDAKYLFNVFVNNYPLSLVMLIEDNTCIRRRECVYYKDCEC